MNTLEKEFIPYEQALELKELGFDEPCFGYYSNGELVYDNHTNNYMQRFRYSAPLYQQAFRWFRGKYGLYGVCTMGDDWNNFHFNIWKNDTMTKTFVASSRSWVYDTYEEAELACLKKLIEIVKSNTPKP